MDKEGRKGPRAAAGRGVRLEKEVSERREESVDVREGADGILGDGPVPPPRPKVPLWCWHGLPFPSGAIPDGTGALGPGERGGGQGDSGQHWRKWAVTTSCSGFRRKRLAAAAGCFPQPPTGSFPLSLDGGSQLRGWAVGAEPQWVLSLGGGQAGLPMELHPFGWFAREGCSFHEQLAWMLA